MTSSTSGHAMKVQDREKSFGAVIGKALTPLKKERVGSTLLLTYSPTVVNAMIFA